MKGKKIPHTHHRLTVEERGRHTTPEPMPASPSQPMGAGEESKDGMAGHRTKHREGFSHNTGNVVPQYERDPEGIAQMGSMSPAAMGTSDSGSMSADGGDGY